MPDRAKMVSGDLPRAKPAGLHPDIPDRFIGHRFAMDDRADAVVPYCLTERNSTPLSRACAWLRLRPTTGIPNNIIHHERPSPRGFMWPRRPSVSVETLAAANTAECLLVKTVVAATQPC